MTSAAAAAAGALSVPARYLFGGDSAVAAEPSGATDALPSTDFLQLSQFLTGKPQLDRTLAAAIEAAFNETQAGFADRVAQTNHFIAANKAEARTIQSVLDTAKHPLADVPRKVMTAWYLGTVGTGKNARAVAYEQALMYPPIADVVVMPTFARGIPGYWADPPAVLLHAAPDAVRPR